MPHDDDIPPLLRIEEMPPVRTQQHLWRHWRELMGELGFSERLLWLAFFEADGRATPVLPRIDQLPAIPDALLLDNLMSVARDVCEDIGDGSVAVLLSRPGPGGLDAADRLWAARLVAAAEAAHLHMWPVHVASDEELVVVTPDDLASAQLRTA